MSEAVTKPSMMMMTSIVSGESLARDIHAHRHRQTDFDIVNLKTFFKVVSGFEGRDLAVTWSPKAT